MEIRTLALGPDGLTTLAVVVAAASILICVIGVLLASSSKTQVKRRGRIIVSFIVVAWLCVALIWKALHD